MRTKILAGCLVMSLLMIADTALLASESPDLSQGAERHLAGHGFLPSQYISDPFVGTYFSNHVGGAQAVNLNTPFYNLDGDLILTLKGDVAYAALGMGFQKRIGQKWAVGMNGSGLIRSGISAQTLIANGAEANTDINAWVKRRLLRNEKSQLSGGLIWNYSSANYVDFRAFAEHIRNGGSLETAPLMTTGKAWGLQGSLQYAYAFNPTFGLRADANFGVRESKQDDSVIMGDNRIGLLGEADLKERYKIPLGLTLGYFQGIPSDRLGSGLSGTVLGFWYTGRENFTVGVESGYLSFPVNNSGDSVDGVFGVFNIKYFF